MQVRVLRPIVHRGKLYEAGSVFDLVGADAGRLAAEGLIVCAEPERPKRKAASDKAAAAKRKAVTK